MSGLGLYVLAADGRTPVHEPDGVAWSRWFETSGEARRVARTEIAGLGSISTVFLGIDHAFREGRPVLFETMSFLGGDDGEAFFARYHTWAEAEAGHAAIVREALRQVEQNAAMIAEVLTEPTK